MPKLIVGKNRCSHDTVTINWAQEVSCHSSNWKMLLHAFMNHYCVHSREHEGVGMGYEIIPKNQPLFSQMMKGQPVLVR